MSDGFHYPFFPTYTAPQQQFQQPQVAQPVIPTGEVLICDFCEQPIVDGEEALNGLYGVGGVGQNTGRPMVVPSKDVPKGEFDLHLMCLPAFLMENLPEIVEEIKDMEYELQEYEEPEEQFCAACDARLNGDGND